MSDADIRPFRVQVDQADIDDLRRRLRATRWPEKETVPDQTQGVPLATIQELVRYWAADYDFRRFEARLNAVPRVGHNLPREAPRAFAQAVIDVARW